MTAANPWQPPKPPNTQPTEFRCTVVGCGLEPAWLSMEHGRRCELHRGITFARRETPHDVPSERTSDA